MFFVFSIYFRIKTISIAPAWHVHVNRNIWALGVVHRVRNRIEIEFGFPIIDLLQIRFVIEFY